MSGHTPEPPRRRRRRLSLSLRALMLLILVVGGLMGWKARRASLQRRAVAKIERLGGSVLYDWQYKNGQMISPTPSGPNAPSWLRASFGDEYFQDVAKVTLSDAMILEVSRVPAFELPSDGPEWRAYQEETRKERERDVALDNDQLSSLDGLDRIESIDLFSVHLRPEGLARLGSMSSLKELKCFEPFDAGGLSQLARQTKLEDLYIDLTREDESDLEFLAGMFRLRVVTIRSRQVTDAGLARLGGLRNIEDLSINGSQITDDDLIHLQGLDKLHSLELDSASRITDAGLARLKSLKALEYLKLPSATGITDAGLAHLVGLDKLAWINLKSAANITDAGMGHLARLPELRVLRLGARPLTDAGLARLRGLTKLKQLRLYDAHLSDGGMKELMAAIPGLEIELQGAEQAPKVQGVKGLDPFELDPFSR